MGQWRAGNELSSPQLISKLEEKKYKKKEGRQGEELEKKKEDLYFAVRWLGQHRHKRWPVKYCQGRWQQGPGCALRSAERKEDDSNDVTRSGGNVYCDKCGARFVLHRGISSACPSWNSILNIVVPGRDSDCPAGVGTDADSTLRQWPVGQRSTWALDSRMVTFYQIHFKGFLTLAFFMMRLHQCTSKEVWMIKYI